MLLGISVVTVLWGEGRDRLPNDCKALGNALGLWWSDEVPFVIQSIKLQLTHTQARTKSLRTAHITLLSL